MQKLKTARCNRPSLKDVHNFVLFVYPFLPQFDSLNIVMSTFFAQFLTPTPLGKVDVLNGQPLMYVKHWKPNDSFRGIEVDQISIRSHQ